MKVALIVGGFPVTSETFITNHVVGLALAGHDVRVYMRRPNWNSPACATSHGVALLPLRRTAVIPGRTGSRRWLLEVLKYTSRAIRCAPIDAARVALAAITRGGSTKPGNPFVTWSRAVPMLDAWNPDVVHCHFGTNGLFGAFLRAVRAVRAPLVVSFHGHDVHAVPRKRGPNVYRHMFMITARVSANTDFTAGKVRDLGCPVEILRVVPMGFFVSQFQRREWRAPEPTEPVEILSVGRLVEKKGFEWAIRSISILKKNGIRVRYRVIGDGELRESLEEAIGREDVTEEVSLVGSATSDAVAAAMAESHLFLLPSVTAQNGDMEGQALVMQEAQACGLPVVATEHNGISEGLLPGESGVLVPERDPGAIAAAVLRICRNRDLARAMSLRGRGFVETKYDQTRLTRQWLEVYREAMTG